MLISKFLCPIVSTNNIVGWKALLENAFGLYEVARESLDENQVEALWGLSGHSAETLLFLTKGTPFGIRLVEFDPGSMLVIRDQATGYDCDALKVIDFYSPDFANARLALERVGHALKPEIAEYPGETGTITEGHLWAPDSVVCALIGGDPDYLEQFVGVTDSMVSEVMSVSGPVADPEPVIAFYQDIGFEEVYRYEVVDDSFTTLVGASAPLHIRAVNMGSSKIEPYFGIVHYGLPTDSYQSLKDKAQIPNRGLVGAIVSTVNIDLIHSICLEQGHPIVAAISTIELAPHGRIRTMAVEAPHGVVHQIFEQAEL